LIFSDGLEIKKEGNEEENKTENNAFIGQLFSVE